MPSHRVVGVEFEELGEGGRRPVGLSDMSGAMSELALGLGEPGVEVDGSLEMLDGPFGLAELTEEVGRPELDGRRPRIEHDRLECVFERARPVALVAEQDSEVLVRDGDYVVVRPRVTAEDLIALDRLPGWLG